MDQKPVFSIIAPVFNESESLNELYTQVSRIMNQSGEPWELVLVDDGSAWLPGGSVKWRNRDHA